jgi:YHS domain-containing protein
MSANSDASKLSGFEDNFWFIAEIYLEIPGNSRLRRIWLSMCSRGASAIRLSFEIGLRFSSADIGIFRVWRFLMIVSAGYATNLPQMLHKKTVRHANKQHLADPACGLSVDPATVGAKLCRHGTRFYFCAEGCKRVFEPNPDKNEA